MKLVESIEFH